MIHESGVISNTIGFSPIFLVAKWPSIPDSLAKAIIEQSKKEMNEFDDEGYNPLHWAIKVGSVKLSHLLLDNGATCETTKDDYRDTVLHLIARFKNWNNKNEEMWVNLVKTLCLVKEKRKNEKTMDHLQCQNSDTLNGSIQKICSA